MVFVVARCCAIELSMQDILLDPDKLDGQNQDSDETFIRKQLQLGSILLLQCSSLNGAQLN